MHLTELIRGVVVTGIVVYQAPIWMAKKALSSYNAGRPDKTVVWAKRAVACRPMLPTLVSAHQAAGLGLSEQGHLEEAQTHYQKAFDLAAPRSRPDLAARSLVLLSSLQGKRGLLGEALHSALTAAGLSAASRRDALVAQADSLRSLGRWQEAGEALHQGQQAQPLPLPQYEQRSQATLRLGLAWTEAEAAQEMGDKARAEQAWSDLQAAQAVFRTDAKLSLWCEATAPWILALLGQADEAKRRMGPAEAALKDFGPSRATRLNVYSMLGRAAFLLGDLQQAQSFWEQFLTAEPDVPGKTRGHYYQGECLRRFGQQDAARTHYQAAVSLSREPYYARLAHKRLTEQGMFR